MRFGLKAALCGVCVAALAACTGGKSAKPEFDRAAVMSLVRSLSSDTLEGRGAGTQGSAQARALIVARLEALGIEPVNGSFEHPFTYGPFRTREGEAAVPDKPGVNVMGLIKGQTSDEAGGGLTLVVTAHYDHLGLVDGEIYNGMDDNASGVGGILAVADYFSRNRPKHDVLIVAFDAEEDGFGGARAFIADPPVPVTQMGFNLNLDMISRGDNGLLWASGAAKTPGLAPIVEALAAKAPVEVKMGFDTGEGRDDWTMLSDHAVFFMAGVPHLYLGVEDHPDYHKPTDDFDKVDQDWFLRSVVTVVLMAIEADARLAEIAALRRE